MRVALLTNFVAPYRVPLFEALRSEVGELRVLVSTQMEANRQWQPDTGDLDVVLQRTLTLQRTWRTDSFSEPYELHIPYDTLTQLSRWRPEVIITGEMGARSIQAVCFARAARKPVVLWATISERLEIQRGAVRRMARRWLVRNVDSIIVNGANGARYFRGFSVPDDRVLRVNQTTDLRPFLALQLQRLQPHRLLYVGRLSEGKAVNRLLDAVDLWAAANPQSQLELTLVGDGPLKSNLQARPKRANVDLTWVGNVPYHELPRWYGSSGILVFPSLGDEWGLVVNEALAAGVPVIGSTYSGAVEELIQDGVNGWVFAPDRAENIEAALSRALSTDAQQLEHMRAHARASVRQLTPEAAAHSIGNRLREVAGR